MQQSTAFNFDPTLLSKQLECELSLRDYIGHMWPVLEPGRVFKHGWSVDAICEHLQAVTEGHIKKLVINVPPGCMKLCSDDTKVLTPLGWRTHGDLKIGDEVFSPSGLPVKITNTSKKAPADRVVTFSNGEKVYCNDDHLWTVYDRRTQKWKTRDTLSLRNTKLYSGGRATFQLPNPSPIVDTGTTTPLPLHPYLLGAWLGDGTKTKPLITHAADDFRLIEEIESRCGLHRTKSHLHSTSNTRATTFTHQGVVEKLRALELYNNKHIPKEYLFNSTLEDKKQLLAGLIDTDGTMSATDKIYIGTSNPRLRDDFLLLLKLLSLRPWVYEVESPPIGGYDNKNPHWRVGFQPTFALPCGLPEKTPKRFVKQRRIGIVSIEKSSEGKVGNCITVDAEDGLYLVGESVIPTHNSLTTEVFWPSWEWGPRNLPSTRYVSASYSEALTVRDNRKARILMGSEDYQQLWGDRFQLLGDQNAKQKFENNHTGFKLATSVGGLGTGERGDRFIIDDPHNVIEGESELKRNSALQWFTEVVPTRVNDPEESVIIVIMQRVHENDVSGLILAKELNYELLSLPMEFEPQRKCYSLIKPSYMPEDTSLEEVKFDKREKAWRKEKEIIRSMEDDNVPEERIQKEVSTLKKQKRYAADPRSTPGELLWPERFSERYLEEELKPQLSAWGGTYAIAGQLQQLPVPRGGGMFQRKDFQYLEPSEVSKLKGRLARGWDLAASEELGAAWTVGVKGMIDQYKRLIILDCVRFQKLPGAVKTEMIATFEQDGRTVQQDIPQDPGQAGKAQKYDFIKDAHGHNLTFSPESGDKVERAVPVASQAEGQNIYLVRGTWNDDFITEFISFPNGAFKDQVDATSRMYTNLIRKRGNVVPIAPKVVE